MRERIRTAVAIYSSDEAFVLGLLVAFGLAFMVISLAGQLASDLMVLQLGG
ncbi:MAG TPA: hypothetical protein VF157_01705 [Chloroflexota bacterium]